tara:strand:- start:1077 stop:1520 length:444 start_codon:yes stop_codon:yes gene_type:complete
MIDLTRVRQKAETRRAESLYNQWQNKHADAMAIHELIGGFSEVVALSGFPEYGLAIDSVNTIAQSARMGDSFLEDMGVNQADLLYADNVGEYEQASIDALGEVSVLMWTDLQKHWMNNYQLYGKNPDTGMFREDWHKKKATPKEKEE